MRLDLSAFDLDGRTVSVGEVLGSAWLAGLLEGDARALEEQCACAALARAEELLVPDEDLDAELDAWREARDLIAASDAEAWFERHGLELDDLIPHLEAARHRERLSKRVAFALERHAPEPSEVRERLAAHLLFLGRLPALGDAVALRRCVPRATDAELALERATLLAGRGLADLGAAVATLASLGVEEGLVPSIVDAEAAYRLWLARLATRDAIAREVAARSAELARLELVTASFASEDVAREVLLCVREDGEPLEEAASRARASIEHKEPLVEDLPRTAFTARLAGARPGATLGPVAEGGRFALHLLLARREPLVSDPVVRARAIAGLVRRALAPEVLRRVRFPIAVA